MPDNFSEQHSPAGVTELINTEFDPDSGGLIVSFLFVEYPGTLDGIEVKLLFDAKVTERLQSSLPTLKKEISELIKAKVSKDSL